MQGASSLESDLAHEAIAPRSVFETPRLGIGSRTLVDTIWIILPYPSDSIDGARSCTSVWAACKCLPNG